MRMIFGVAALASLSLGAVSGFSQVVQSGGNKSGGTHGGGLPPSSGTWTRTTHINTANAGTPILLTDGTVLIQVPNRPQWWKLTPDNTGSYLNGTWSQMASLPSGYSPLYYASAVLADGRVVALGGEYNGSNSGVWTNLGAIYDPVANTWTSLAGPGWSDIGDAQCAVLPDGRFLLAHLDNTQMAYLNPTTLAWTASTGSGKRDRQDEEGWNLLPDGTIFTVDAENSTGSPNAERYIPSLDTWIGAGTTPARMEDANSEELGPMVLRPNGTLFVMGATGANAVYTPPTTLMGSGSWVAAPSFPTVTGGQLDIADGPACLLPDGNVLCMASPGVFNTPSDFFEFDGTNLTQVASPPRASQDTSYLGCMLMLPTGQVLFTDQISADVEIYTPVGGPQDAWRPAITSVSSTIQQSSSNNLLQGTQLNGLSQCSAYGDDMGNATNYPLVRVQNGATNHVFYFRTHNHSTMAVATGSTVVSTLFDVPAGVETGPSTMFVVTNGIASPGQTVNVVAPHVVLPNSYSFFRGVYTSGNVNSLFFNDASYLVAQPGPTANSNEAPLQYQVSSTSPTLSPSSLQFTFTGNVNTVGLSQSILLYNFTTGAYESLNTTGASHTTDQTTTVTASGTLSRFVNQSTGEVRARVTFTQTGPTSLFPWTANANVMNWVIQ